MTPDLDTVPDGELTEVYQVCAACVAKSPASFPAPVLAVDSAALPTIRQRSDTYFTEGG